MSHQAEFNDSDGGGWGKSLEAFAFKVASRWQTAFCAEQHLQKPVRDEAEQLDDYNRLSM